MAQKRLSLRSLKTCGAHMGQVGDDFGTRRFLLREIAVSLFFHNKCRAQQQHVLAAILSWLTISFNGSNAIARGKLCDLTVFTAYSPRLLSLLCRCALLPRQTSGHHVTTPERLQDTGVYSVSQKEAIGRSSCSLFVIHKPALPSLVGFGVGSSFS